MPFPVLNPRSATCLVASCLISCRAFALPAFPGAEGAGANAVGGRGGGIYFVTNLNDSGAGSLRTGVATANRTIIFKVSGTIDLLTDLSISRNNITIAGQTAPGDGITLRRRNTSVQNCRDVIIRYIRCRPGDADSTFQDDSFHVVSGTNIVVDHVSASWSVDECLSVTHSTNITVQWCMISESLKNSQHDKGSHGYGTLLRYGEGALTYHHNLYQHHDSRNPRLGDRLKLDFVNNVLYNWGGRAGYSGGNGATEDAKDNPGGVFTNYLNYVGNYLIAGPSSATPNTAFASGATNTVIYQSGNWIDSNKNPILDGTNTGPGMFSGFPYTASASRYPVPSVTNDTAVTAYQRVLAFVGASQFRDEVDTRLIGNVRNHIGRLVDAVGTNTQATDYVTNTVNGTNYIFVRGWPALNSTTPPLDSDNDAIPNYWESALGWNPSAANNNHVNADGYTDLEWYLNWLADRHTHCDRNGSVEVNLRALVGGYTNFNFAVASGSNGAAILLADGYTARFIATNNFSGLASFSFTASNTVDAAAFGPENVAVLISTTNAPSSNTAPFLATISNYSLIAGQTLRFTNFASDTDLPPQSLAFQLENAPAGATLSTNTGIFDWRPAMTQTGGYDIKVILTDNGTPALSATQSFTAAVSAPSQPQMLTVRSGSYVATAINGDLGPDYSILASPDLTNWNVIFTTNPPTLPWLWIDPQTNLNQRFYRVQLGP